MVEAKFALGQLVVHELYGYRGVIVDVDACFSLSDDWYQRMALSRPAKQQPWYLLLVNNSSLQTYVAEQHLLAESEPKQISHPLLNSLLGQFQHGSYGLLAKTN